LREFIIRIWKITFALTIILIGLASFIDIEL